MNYTGRSLLGPTAGEASLEFSNPFPVPHVMQDAGTFYQSKRVPNLRGENSCSEIIDSWLATIPSFRIAYADSFCLNL